jgi:hypothetical protein
MLNVVVDSKFQIIQRLNVLNLGPRVRAKADQNGRCPWEVSVLSDTLCKMDLDMGSAKLN